MKKLLFLLSVIIFTSCKKQNDLEKSLTDDTKKWGFYFSKENFTEEASKGISSEFFHIFKRNGDWISNVLPGEKKTGKWNYSEKDSILHIFDGKFKVLKFTKDTIYLQLANTDKKPLLVNIAGL